MSTVSPIFSAWAGPPPPPASKPCRNYPIWKRNAAPKILPLSGPLHTASNEMCTFLILNISSLQLIPVNLIAYRKPIWKRHPRLHRRPRHPRHIDQHPRRHHHLQTNRSEKTFLNEKKEYAPHRNTLSSPTLLFSESILRPEGANLFSDGLKNVIAPSQWICSAKKLLFLQQHLIHIPFADSTILCHLLHGFFFIHAGRQIALHMFL